MIIGVFELGGDQVEVIVDVSNIMFRDTSTGTTTTIEGLKLSRPGVIREHPDLKDEEKWREIAIKRLKEHIKKYKTENRKLYYIKNELSKFGYKPLFKQRAGFRPEKF